jgi:hypothetical protein
MTERGREREREKQREEREGERQTEQTPLAHHCDVVKVARREIQQIGRGED